MSGAEVTGLLLSALPLVTATLNSVHDLADLKRMWLTYDRTLKTAERRVKRAKLRYFTIRETVFQSVVDNDEEQKRWIEDDFRKEWSNIADVLHNRVPSIRWQRYLEVMEDLENAFEKLVHQMKMDNAGVDGKEHGVAAVVRKVRFCTSEKHRERYFCRVELLISELDRMCPGQGNGQAFMPSSTGLSALTASRRRQLRGYHRLHVHLAGPEIWDCLCHTSHCIDMALHRSATSDSELHICLRPEPHTLPACDNQRWKSLKVRMREEKHLPPSNDVGRHNIPSIDADENLAGMGRPRRSILKLSQSRKDSLLTTFSDCKPQRISNRVAFDTSSCSSSIDSTKSPISNEPAAPVPQHHVDTIWSSSTLSEPGLCTTLAKWRGNPGDCLYKVVDNASSVAADTENTSGKGYSLEMAETSCPSQTMTLTQVLASGQSLRFDRAHRLFVAYQMASLHLPNQHEAWLNSSWTRDDVVFGADGGRPDFAQPLFRRRCSGLDATTPPVNLGSSLIRFAIVLLELFYGMPFTQHPVRQQWTPMDDDMDVSFIDYAAAIQLADLVEEDLGLRYASAVKWCLNHNSVTADDIDGAFHEEVVLPLRESYVFFTGTSLP